MSKIVWMFDNINALCSIKKSKLKTIWVKLDLLNSILYIIYKLKFKVIDKSFRYYHLVGSFNTKDISKLLLYQIRKEIY